MPHGIAPIQGLAKSSPWSLWGIMVSYIAQCRCLDGLRQCRIRLPPLVETEGSLGMVSLITHAR